MRNVVIGFLGTQLDMGKNRPWRPTVALCTHPGFPVDRLELIHDGRHYHLACRIQADIRALSPETEVRLVRMDMHDPWDFQEVYGKLYDFAADYGFDEDRERYHVHLTTGTHVAQICWFLLTESRHIPARLIQTAPPTSSFPDPKLDVIDLDLARYDALQRRFAQLRGGSLVTCSNCRGSGEKRSRPCLRCLGARVCALPLSAPVLVEAVVYREANRGDLSGYLDAIGDVLQTAGVVANDRQIVGWPMPSDGSLPLRIDRERPRIELVIHVLADDAIQIPLPLDEAIE